MLLLLVSLLTSPDHIVTTLPFVKDTLKHNKVITALLMNESRQKNCSDWLSRETVPWLALVVGELLGCRKVLVGTCGVLSPRIISH